jgi:flagellar motor switch protein FliM
MDSQSPKKRKGKVKYVVPYDFKRPKLFSKEIMRTISQIHDNVARGMSRIFSTSLSYKVDVSLSRIEQFTPTDLVSDMPTPSVIYIMEGHLMGGDIILDMPPEFCIHIIDRESGGAGIDLSYKRVLTTIEEKIISRIQVRIQDEIIKAWEPFLRFDVDNVHYENKPENIHLGSVDPLLTAKIKIDLNEAVIELGISYTYSFLKRALNDSIIKKDRGSNLERLNHEESIDYRRTLKKAPVRIQPLLGITRLSLDDILSLKEGDTIPLLQKADEPLEIKVNGVTKMNGYPGLKQGRKAIKVFEIIEEINEQELV